MVKLRMYIHARCTADSHRLECICTHYTFMIPCMPPRLERALSTLSTNPSKQGMPEFTLGLLQSCGTCLGTEYTLKHPYLEVHWLLGVHLSTQQSQPLEVVSGENRNVLRKRDCYTEDTWERCTRVSVFCRGGWFSTD